mmetsp:Transcript_82140/g.256519  ORF Transcript_82140/g.256519 Transcript_82140/m.256519 type:complete len:234 (-) Transcript_82140:9-710(-)
MEFCPDGNLDGQILDAGSRDNYVLPRLAIAWVAEIFLGLEHLHLEARMLIRDVKPDNVVFARGHRAKVADFGLSRLAMQSDGRYTWGLPPGTPHYVAPEVVDGKPYDYHADFYSFAVLVWVLFTGGIKGAKYPVPPCGDHETQGLKVLTKNRELLLEAIEQPARWRARRLQSEEAKDFVLRLTDRAEGYQRLTHADVRQHDLLRSQALPPQGDVTAATEWQNRREERLPVDLG